MERYDETLERIARTLDESNDYRVLRRLVPRAAINPPDGTATHVGLFVDVETTGLDSSNDEVIELAMVPFTFGMNGRIFKVGRPFQQFSEPAIPLPLEVQRLTGISPAQLTGQRINVFEVGDFVSRADLIVAHHAQFDRPFLERLSPAFLQKPWACSMSQVDWRGLGHESTKLEYLALKSGFFFDGHRAVMDCFAGIELLAGLAGQSTAMKHLLAAALQTSWRVGVIGSSFASNSLLRDRGYRWSQIGGDGKRGWETEIDDQGKETELAFLRSDSFKGAQVRVERVTPFERFSKR